jgi:hypothetical protein
MSDFSEENLLSAIEQVKVNNRDTFSFYVSFYTAWVIILKNSENSIP